MDVQGQRLLPVEHQHAIATVLHLAPPHPAGIGPPDVSTLAQKRRMRPGVSTIGRVRASGGKRRLSVMGFSFHRDEVAADPKITSDVQRLEARLASARGEAEAWRQAASPHQVQMADALAHCLEAQLAALKGRSAE